MNTEGNKGVDIATNNLNQPLQDKISVYTIIDKKPLWNTWS